MAKDSPIEETTRDIRAARAELTGRRDQASAEYDDRLAALDSLAGAVESGSMTPKSAQAQVRKILAGDRRQGMPRQAGRTTIGMSLPTTAKTQAAPTAQPQSRGPTVARTQMAVSKLLSALDRRVIHILAVSKGGEARKEAQFELSFLLQIRRGLESHLEEMPNDVILLTSVVEYTEHAQSVLDDLEVGGAERLRRLLDHDRTLASELMALGGSVGGIKEQIQQARSLLAEIRDNPGAAAAGQGEGAAQAPWNKNLRQALAQALAAFAQLQSELQKRFPVRDPSLLDDILLST